MGMSVTLTVYGRPAPKGSRISGRRKDGTVFSRPASKFEKDWTDTVAKCCARPVPLEPPYRVELRFHFVEPKRPVYGWHVKADIDKLARCTLDGLQKGGRPLIVDDKHVVELSVCKRWAGDGVERCEITVESVSL